MLGITKLDLPQPVVIKPVAEFLVTNWFGRWMRGQNWAGFTLPLPFVVVILYWGIPSRRTRYHEWIHTFQDARNCCFAVSWVKYVWGFLKTQSYRDNPAEAEAYATTNVVEQTGFPSWV